jgi:transposase
MNSTTVSIIGLDLAKNIFQVHGANADGKKIFNKPIKRDKLAEFFQLQPPCLVAMEACSSAHHWGRLIRSMGHEVRLIAPQHVKIYVQGSKHDAADARAICEAASRPRTRFVSIKSVEQQADMSVHRVRQSLIKERTAQANQIRGLLAEFGLIVPQGIHHISQRVTELIEDASYEIPRRFRLLIQSLVLHFKYLHEQVLLFEQQIQEACKAPAARQLKTIPGIGPITASAFAASISDVDDFKNGRQVSAWVGLVPAQHSSGGKTQMLGISKRGDSYLRTLLVHGARSVVWALQKKLKMHAAVQGLVPLSSATLCKPSQPSTVLAPGIDLGLVEPVGTVEQGGGLGVPALSAQELWLVDLLQRRPANVVVVALAARNARIIWAVLKSGRNYEPGYVDARLAKSA